MRHIIQHPALLRSTLMGLVFQKWRRHVCSCKDTRLLLTGTHYQRHGIVCNVAGNPHKDMPNEVHGGACVSPRTPDSSLVEDEERQPKACPMSLWRTTLSVYIMALTFHQRAMYKCRGHQRALHEPPFFMRAAHLPQPITKLLGKKHLVKNLSRNQKIVLLLMSKKVFTSRYHVCMPCECRKRQIIHAERQCPPYHSGIVCCKTPLYCSAVRSAMQCKEKHVQKETRLCPEISPTRTAPEEPCPYGCSSSTTMCTTSLRRRS
jgi:hypothetical protein